MCISWVKSIQDLWCLSSVLFFTRFLETSVVKIATMSKKKIQGSPNTIAQNKKARHDYDILKTLEGGLVLMGSEVKSIRLGHASISECYAQFNKDKELFLVNSHISAYANAGYAGHEETRGRKVLLHKNELNKLFLEKEKLSLTLVPLKLYWKDGKVKVEIALVRGRKNHDKRAASKDQDWKRQQARLLRR